MLIAATISIAFHPTNFYSILSVRIIAGIAFGLSYNSSLIYASEISTPAYRSTNLFSLQLSLTIGMFLHALLLVFNLDVIVGVLQIVFALLSIMISLKFTKNSQIYELFNGRDGDDSFQHFQNVTNYADFKQFALNERKRSFNFFTRHNIQSFCVVLITTIGYISIFNAFHNYIRLIFMKNFLMKYSDVIALAGRLVGATFLIFVIEKFHKKIQFSIPLILISVILSSYGGTFIFITFGRMIPVVYFVIIEFLVGFGVSGLSDILKCELFPLKEKPVFVAVTGCVQELLHIAAIIVIYSHGLSLGSNPDFWSFIFAAIAFVSGIVVILFLKDTRKMNLMETCEVYE